MKTVKTYINGLDEILAEGFLFPSVVLVAGNAGAGKTIFVMQSSFNSARNNEKVLYLSTLSEPLIQINNFMANFAFYDVNLIIEKKVEMKTIDEDCIGNAEKTLAYIDGIADEVRPDRLVIDPVNILGQSLDDKELRVFWYKLFSKMKGWNILTILTGEFNKEQLEKSVFPYLVDGIIFLSNESFNGKMERFIDILKMRGQGYASGKHRIKISNRGIKVFPRIKVKEGGKFTDERISTGIVGLDAMLQVGLLKNSTTLITGATGAGKTTLGLQFLVDGALKGEKGIIITLEEFPDQLRRNAKSFNWNLKNLEEKNLLKIIYYDGDSSDELLLTIRNVVEEEKPKRLLFDSITNFQSLFKEVEKISSLANFLKSNGVTSLFINEVPEIIGAFKITESEVAIAMDNVILLRYIEIESAIKRSIAVLKTRGSNHDKEIKEFEITKKGIEVKTLFKGMESVLSGTPRKGVAEKFSEAFKL